MEPWYDKAEKNLGVTQTNGIPGLPGNNNYKVLRLAQKTLAIKMFTRVGWRLIANLVMVGLVANRSVFAFRDVNLEQMVCCIQDIPQGEATGNLEVRTNAQVLKIEHDKKGKVTGVIYADKDGNQQLQKARIVAVAGNSIESPRLTVELGRQCFRTDWRTAPVRSVKLYASCDSIYVCV